MVSVSLKQALYRESTDEAFIVLLTIDHADLAVPIRVCSDNVDTTSNGDLYQAFPFNLTLPLDSPETPARAKLVIDNVSRVVTDAARAITGKPSVDVVIVRAADPDTIEVGLLGFEMTNIESNALTVSGDLSFEDYQQEPYPAVIFGPGDFPGLF